MPQPQYNPASSNSYTNNGSQFNVPGQGWFKTSDQDNVYYNTGHGIKAFGINPSQGHTPIQGLDFNSLPSFNSGFVSDYARNAYNQGQINAENFDPNTYASWTSGNYGNGNVNSAGNYPGGAVPGAPMIAMKDKLNLPTSNLQEGMQGDNVKQLQDWLVKNGYMTQDQVNTGYGTYGPQTKSAVAALQKKLGVDTGGNDGFFGPKTINALKNPYAQGFAGMKGEAPNSPAEASAMMQGSIPSPEGPSIVDDLMSSDENFNGFFTEWQKGIQDYFSPKNQKKSLVDEYKSLLKETGIEGIDAELINDKKVIEGTEDDIRNEVMKAGGFATESQIQALTLARNKSLIKNYNTLLDTRNSKADYLNNMMNLSQQDRQEANQQFDRMMNMGFKMMDYRDKMKQNAVDSYNKIVQNSGYDGLLKMANGSQNAIKTIEKTLGIGNGGLQQLATQDSEARNVGLQEKALDRKYKQAQIDKIYADIGETTGANVKTDALGKVIVKPAESMKINKELVNNDAYKAIQKGKDSLQFLNEFESKFKETGATSAVFSPRQNAELKAKYNTAILNLKEFFNLGVLNGPDETILRSVLPDPTNRSAFLTGASLGIYKPSAGTKAGLDNLKKMIETSLDERFKNLTSQYGDYSASSLGSLRDLNRSYIQQKASLNPQIKKLVDENPNLDMDDLLSIIVQ